MPANPKYLTRSPWQRFAKISAGILGGYLLSTALHLALASWLDQVVVLITSSFSIFLLWATFIILAFLARNGWKIWGIYLLAILFCGLAVYCGTHLKPVVI